MDLDGGAPGRHGRLEAGDLSVEQLEPELLVLEHGDAHRMSVGLAGGRRLERDDVRQHAPAAGAKSGRSLDAPWISRSRRDRRVVPISGIS